MPTSDTMPGWANKGETTCLIHHASGSIIIPHSFTILAHPVLCADALKTINIHVLSWQRVEPMACDIMKTMTPVEAVFRY